MGNRGQKRLDMAVDLPDDKRACSSLDFRPSSSGSSVQTHLNSTNSTPETHHNDMDTSSSASASSRSEGEPEKDSGYGSCDSDDGDPRHSGLRDYQRRRSSGDHGKLRNILGSLNVEGDPSTQLVALTELCEVLSFGTEDSLSSMMVDSLSPSLVKLARHENSPDIMLLAIRAITYLCDVFPRSAGLLVRHDAVPALCQRLMAIEYLDVAEQCLQALEKISRDQALACLQAGAIMAVLTYIEFFSMSIQRVALSTVVNICKKLPSECPSPFMEAVPILCNLLQYEDQKLVESVATCLIKITDRVSHSSEMLDELCRHSLIHQVTHLVNLNSRTRTSLSQPIYSGLIGLLVKICSGSCVAFKTLYELKISSIIKDMLSTYDLSHGISSPLIVDGHCNQVHEVLKLLNELLPTSAGVQMVSEKQSLLVDQPDLLQQFGMDILPMLIQVVNSGASIYVCYGCLSVIQKLLYLSKSDTVVEILKSANIPSFLAGVFTRKDQHVLILALEIADIILQKLPDTFLNSFIKEGVFFAIDALLTQENGTQSLFPVFGGILPCSNSNQRSSGREVLRCLCYAFDTSVSSASSEPGTCKHDKDSVQNLAKSIRTKYFSPDLLDSGKGLTDILLNLKTLAAALNELMGMSTSNDASAQSEEKFYCLLHQIMEKLNGNEPVSTFEFIESGIVKALVNYLSNGLYLRDHILLDGTSSLYAVEKRCEMLARLLLSSSDVPSQDLPLSILVRRLQSALSSLENFPVILSHGFRHRSMHATVPFGRCISHTSLRVRFVRGDGETTICDFSEHHVTVDPFCSLDDIEGYLWPKVSIVPEDAGPSAQAMDQMKIQPLHVLSEVNPVEGESSGSTNHESMAADLPPMKLDNMSTGLPEMQVDEANISAFASKSTVTQSNPHNAQHLTENHDGCSSGHASLKLSFFLEGQKLNCKLTLYQAILQQQIKADNEIMTGSQIWSQLYTITYRRAIELKHDDPQGSHNSGQLSHASDKIEANHTSFFSSLFGCELACDVKKSSPIYDILFLLKCLEGVNRFTFHLLSNERILAFSEGRISNLDDLRVVVGKLQQNDFICNKLTEKLEQQIRDSSTFSIGGMPSWCNQLMASCPFLFSFEGKCKYFRLAAFGSRQIQPHSPRHNNPSASNERRPAGGSVPRKKFLVCRNRILESAAQMMDQHAHSKALLEVEYNEEVGTGLGPTLEFYTLVSHEFQKSGFGMWRDDHNLCSPKESSQDDIVVNFDSVMSTFGLFPRPWSSATNASDGVQFSDVLKKFVLLGQIVAKALQDGRVLDLPFSKAFYKLILGKELSLYDIPSFDPELGRTMLEFKALVARKKLWESTCGETTAEKPDLKFRNTRVEDLCLDFTLPGFADYVLASGIDHKMVNIENLDDYVTLVVDATIHSGINRQVEAFKSGFCQVFSVKHLQIFNEEELERLLCGERDIWTFNDVLDHIKFDHGYTSSSPPVVSLLEIIQEFDHEQQRAFLQFVTGAPRLPPGGLASLNPKLTIVRKHCGDCVDAGLPSVMTCANYLKLPPYSSKERMKEKLLYAITEGQGSFHLS